MKAWFDVEIPAPLLWVYVCILGAIVGSYLNVVVHRVPLGLSTVKPRSRCPYCGGGIRARDNVPVLSWLWLRGRCHCCNAPISARYPTVEMLTAVAFAACAIRFGQSWGLLVSLLFVSLLIALGLIDFDHFLLPDKITLPGIVLGLALTGVSPLTTLLDALLGVVTGAGLLILLINFWYWIREEEGMGLGDVNMLAMIGAFLGWQGVLITLLLAAFSGAFFGLGAMLFRKLEMKSSLPFGVFLTLGAFATLFFGEVVANFYARML